MSTIKETAYSPESIGDIKFRIPLYQRPYAWETNQVSQLLNDLWNQFDKSKNKNENENYYIGILSVGKTDADDKYDLIDGQQRITTLMLIGRVLSENHEEWKAFLSERLDLYGREEDKKYLETLDKSLNPNPKMVEAIKVIIEFLKKNNQANFSSYVYKKASFFISEVPEDYTIIEKNLQFVRMNNRGKQLEAHDILKIKLACYFNIENEEEKQKRNDFVNKWNEFSQLGCFDEKIEPENQKSLNEILKDFSIQPIQPKESEILYQSIVSYPEFLLIALKRFNYNTEEEPLYVSVSYRKDKLMEEFGFGEKKLEFEWNRIKVHDFLKLLQNQYEAYNSYFIKRDKYEAYKFKRIDDNTDAFDLNAETSEIKKLEIFQSYLYVSREAHNWLKKAFDYVNEIEKKGKVIASDFLKKLKEIDNEYKEFENVSLTYGHIDRYWFWRLDYYLWEKRKELFKDELLKVVEKYTFKSNRSIEHLHPQDEENNSKWGDKQIVDSFGNLAMISSGFNSTQSNDNVAVKFGRIKEQLERGTLESIKLLIMYEKANMDNKGWTIDVLQRHENEMIRIIIDSFDKEKYKTIVDVLEKPKQPEIN